MIQLLCVFRRHSINIDNDLSLIWALVTLGPLESVPVGAVLVDLEAEIPELPSVEEHVGHLVQILLLFLRSVRLDQAVQGEFSWAGWR